MSSSAPALKPLAHSLLRGSSNGSDNYVVSGNGSRSKTPGTGNGGRSRNYSKTGDHESRLDGYSKNTMKSNIGRGSANTSQENIVSPDSGILRTTDVKIDIEMDKMKRQTSEDSEDSLRRLEFGH